MGLPFPSPFLVLRLPPPWWAFPFRQELTPDYSMESHQRDHENYVACLRSHRRRAKALLDFERHDDDELGFRKNDIITVCGGLARVLPGPCSPPPLPRADAAAEHAWCRPGGC